MTAFMRPSAWTRQAVRSYAEGNMLGAITILRGSLGTLDPATGLVGGLSGATTVYDGPARIRTVSGGTTIDLGGGEIAVNDTTISIPMGAPVPRRDDLVRVTDDDISDTDLKTRIFRVLGVDGGGYFGDARRLHCQGWSESRYWSPS